MSLEQLTTRLFELEARYRLRPTSSLEPTWPIRDKYAIARARSRSPFSAPHSPFPQPAKFRSPSPSRRLPPDFWQASREYSPYSAQLSSMVAHGSSGHVSAWAAGPPRGLAGSFPSSFSRPVQHPHLVHESAGYAKSNQYHPIMIHVNEPVTRPEPATILLARSRYLSFQCGLVWQRAHVRLGVHNEHAGPEGRWHTSNVVNYCMSKPRVCVRVSIRG